MTVPAGTERETASWPTRPPILFAVSLIAAIVGGVAFGMAQESLAASCISDAGAAALFGVPPCDALWAAALIAAIVCGVGVMLAAALLLRSPLPRAKRLGFAGVLVVAFLVIVAGIPALLAPAAAGNGAQGSVPFPIPAGSVFNLTTAVELSVDVLVPASPYLLVAPTRLVGAYNATEFVCVVVGTGSAFVPGLSPVGGCGTSLAFSFPVSTGAWELVFYLPAGIPAPLVVTLAITQPVEVVY